VAELLTLKNVRMEYPMGKTKLISIDDVTFSVERNEFVSIIGPSGCGKSTILKMVLGLIEPSSGSILINGDPISDNRSRLSVVFQNPALFPVA